MKCVLCKKADADMSNNTCHACWAQQNGVSLCHHCGKPNPVLIVTGPGVGFCPECAGILISHYEQQYHATLDEVKRLKQEVITLDQEIEELEKRSD